MTARRIRSTRSSPCAGPHRAESGEMGSATPSEWARRPHTCTSRIRAGSWRRSSWTTCPRELVFLKKPQLRTTVPICHRKKEHSPPGDDPVPLSPPFGSYRPAPPQIPSTLAWNPGKAPQGAPSCAKPAQAGDAKSPISWCRLRRFAPLRRSRSPPCTAPEPMHAPGQEAVAQGGRPNLRRSSKWETEQSSQRLRRI